MALSEDAIAIVAAQLTTALLAKKPAEEVTGETVIELYDRFRERITQEEATRNAPDPSKSSVFIQEY